VKDLLVQLGLYKALKENIFNMDNKKWEELDRRDSSAICMSLAKYIIANVLGTLSSKKHWEKLVGLYQTEGISNRFLNEQFHSLHIDKNTKVFGHLSTLNDIAFELETI